MWSVGLAGRLLLSIHTRPLHQAAGPSVQCQRDFLQSYGTRPRWTGSPGCQHSIIWERGSGEVGGQGVETWWTVYVRPPNTDVRGGGGIGGLLGLNASPSTRAISRRWNYDEMSVSLLKETRVPGENHGPTASKRQVPRGTTVNVAAAVHNISSL